MASIRLVRARIRVTVSFGTAETIRGRIGGVQSRGCTRGYEYAGTRKNTSPTLEVDIRTALLGEGTIRFEEPT
jgi:hypothetical protein